MELEEIDDANNQFASEVQCGKKTVDKDVMMGESNEKVKESFAVKHDSDDSDASDSGRVDGYELDLRELQRYYEEHVVDVNVDRGKYEDKELAEM